MERYMAGFIYIMSNPSFASGRIKIGKSDRDPEEFRKVELDVTSVPEPFKVEYYAFVDDHHRLERILHETFSHARANKQREFFDVPVREVIQEIKRIAQIRYEMDRYTEEARRREQEQKVLQEARREQEQKVLLETWREQNQKRSILREARREQEQKVLGEIPNSRTKYISRICTKCSTPFSVTVVRGELDTRCPECV
jgi:hypothetical protein